MKIAFVRGWQWRLVVAGVLSLALHLVSLAWLPGPVAPPHAAEHAPLSLRLLSPAPPRGAQARAASAAAGQAAATGHEGAATRKLADHPRPRQSSHEAPAVPSGGAVSAPAPGRPAGDPLAAPSDADLAPMPGRYHVRLPPPALLSYSVTLAASGQPPRDAGVASIAWQTDGNRYQLRLDGVLGQLSSTGHSGDAGILPVEAREQRADGTSAITRFDEGSGTISFSTSQRSYPVNVGSQDRASVLMQLAGIGLQDPDQVADRLDVFVAGADDAAIARYKVVGREQVDTGVGTLAAWHLVRLAAAGQPRLELWLAPERSWYPVQLRVTGPGGTVTTQVLRAVEPAPALP